MSVGSVNDGGTRETTYSGFGDQSVSRPYVTNDERLDLYNLTISTSIEGRDVWDLKTETSHGGTRGHRNERTYVVDVDLLRVTKQTTTFVHDWGDTSLISRGRTQ